MSVTTTGKNKIVEAVAASNEATVAATTKAVEQAGSATTKAVEQMSNATTNVVEQANSQMRAGAEATQAGMRQGVDRAMRTAEDLVTFGQGNLEAFLKSGQIWAAGVQDLSKQVAANAQGSWEQTLSAFRALTGVKSIKDAVNVQTGFARSALEKTVTDSSRLTDASMKLAEQAIAPLAARVTLAVERFSRAA